MSANPQPSLDTRYPHPKYFRICLACPYFCRIEEGTAMCPWCELPLIAACPCGRAVEDPSFQGCAGCGKSLRPDPQLEQTREIAEPRLRRR